MAALLKMLPILRNNIDLDVMGQPANEFEGTVALFGEAFAPASERRTAGGSVRLRVGRVPTAADPAGHLEAPLRVELQLVVPSVSRTTAPASIWKSVGLAAVTLPLEQTRATRPLSSQCPVRRALHHVGFVASAVV